jgi:diguanylate cyclase (GGDEF)-like protein
MVERIRKTLSTTPFETSTGQTFFVSFSAGIAEIEPRLAPAQSLELADGALYRAKSAGRNRVFLSDCTAAA